MAGRLAIPRVKQVLLVMPRGQLIGQGQSLVEFILGRALAPRSRAQVRAIYAELAEQVRTGLLTAPVERIYQIDEIRTAVAHAERGERTGKILVAPNGPAR
ncbi:MAG TPA: zinc-binding dehydrogenase [Methylomirabilota bacterium]